MSSNKKYTLFHTLLISFTIYKGDLQDVRDGQPNVHDIQFEVHDFFDVTLMRPSRNYILDVKCIY